MEPVFVHEEDDNPSDDSQGSQPGESDEDTSEDEREGLGSTQVVVAEKKTIVVRRGPLVRITRMLHSRSPNLLKEVS